MKRGCRGPQSSPRDILRAVAKIYNVPPENIVKTTKRFLRELGDTEGREERRDGYIMTNIKEDIKKVVEYLWDDEERHYKESEEKKGHIFESLKRIQKHLKKTKMEE